MKTAVKRLDGKEKLLKLTRKMEVDMRSFCRDNGIESESELIRQAIAKYIYADYKDETLKLQGLKKIEDNITELRDMLNILFIYVETMHTNLLAYNPEIDPALIDAAYASATTRHDKFFNAFQNRLKNAPPFFERVLHKYFSEASNA
jgi:hypothetical protein